MTAAVEDALEGAALCTDRSPVAGCSIVQLVTCNMGLTDGDVGCQLKDVSLILLRHRTIVHSITELLQLFQRVNLVGLACCLVDTDKGIAPTHLLVILRCLIGFCLRGRNEETTVHCPLSGGFCRTL